jgi:hypothetical protein
MPLKKYITNLNDAINSIALKKYDKIIVKWWNLFGIFELINVRKLFILFWYFLTIILSNILNKRYQIYMMNINYNLLMLLNH